MRALHLRHTEGHERQGWSSPPSGAARHLGSRESSIIHKNKTAEGAAGALQAGDAGDAADTKGSVPWQRMRQHAQSHGLGPHWVCF